MTAAPSRRQRRVYIREAVHRIRWKRPAHGSWTRWHRVAPGTERKLLCDNQRQKGQPPEVVQESHEAQEPGECCQQCEGRARLNRERAVYADIARTLDETPYLLKDS